MLFRSRIFLAVLFPVVSSLALGQQTSPTPNPDQPEDKRIFWIIPNYRTSPSLYPYEPLTAEEKFRIATEDSFDRGTAALAVLFAGEAQLTNATPGFGQGIKGYARYLGTSYADFVIGDVMTEAVFPAGFIRTRVISGAGREAAGPAWRARLARSSGPTRTPITRSSIFRRSSAIQPLWRFRPLTIRTTGRLPTPSPSLGFSSGSTWRRTS